MSSVLKTELGRMIEALQLAQKKGCFNLDEAASVHTSIITIQKLDLNSLDTSDGNTQLLQEKNQLVQNCQQLQNERSQLIGLLEEYKKAIEEFKKQHDVFVVQSKQQEDSMKKLQNQINILEKENSDLKTDLTELINAEGDETEDAIIPVVKAKTEKPKKKTVTKSNKVKV